VSNASAHQHQGVVVDVDDPGLRRHPLRYLVGVVHGGQPGADVQELTDPRLAGQITDDAGEHVCRAISTMPGKI
jgi:hypothetical protein